jgi:hypothetical protein
MHLRPIDIRFPYLASIVPEGRREVRTTVVGATTTAAVPCVAPDETRVAFRISYTERDAWPLLHPRKQNLGNPSGFLRRATTLTIIEYGGAIWWPLSLDGGFCYPGPLATDAECVEWMSSGYAFWYREGTSAHVSRDATVSARGFVEDGHDAALADVLRQVSENLLVCGSQWYVRGGVPVFVKRLYRSGKVWEIDVADPGPDRAIGDASAFTASLRNFVSNDEAFRSNPVWSALQHETAAREAHRLQPEVPNIEVLMPDLVADRRVAIRADALLRRSLEMFEDPLSMPWDAEAAVCHRMTLAEAARATGDDEGVTIRRAHALRDFFSAHLSEGDCPYFAELRANFRFFLEECASSQPALFRSLNQSREAFSHEEEDALDLLAATQALLGLSR